MHVDAMKAHFRAGPPVMISVHRALWGPLPENSASAIRAAAGWDVVEVDLRLDEGGRPYLMHDASLSRMTGAWAASDGVDPAFLQSLRLKQGAGGDGAEMTDEAVPGLQCAVTALEGSDTVFDLDVKRDEDVEAVASAVADLGFQGCGTLKIDVADEDDLARVKALEAKYDIMIMAKSKLRNEQDLDLFQTLREADIALVEVWFGSFDLLEKACAIGGDEMRLGVYTLDGVHCCGCSDARAVQAPDEVWGRLIDCGVGLIMTDQARKLRTYLESR